MLKQAIFFIFSFASLFLFMFPQLLCNFFSNQLVDIKFRTIHFQSSQQVVQPQLFVTTSALLLGRMPRWEDIREDLFEAVIQVQAPINKEQQAEIVRIMREKGHDMGWNAIRYVLVLFRSISQLASS